jgi:acylphosphatase
LWWPGIVFIPFFSIVLIIFLGKKSGNFFRFMAGVVMFFWGAYALINLVPQIGYYTKLDTVISSVIPGEIAKKANNIEKIRQEQRSISLGSVYEKALEWQKLNPGRDLPVEFQENIEAAKKGLAVGELRQQKFSEKAKEDADDDEKNADQYAQNLSDGTIRIVHKGTNDYSKNFFLFPGTYDVNPKGKKFKISMKSTDWKFKEFSDELTVPDVANGKNQNMYFHSDENETFLIKKKEAKG